jgi:ATP-dependent helicase HrpB
MKLPLLVLKSDGNTEELLHLSIDLFLNHLRPLISYKSVVFFNFILVSNFDFLSFGLPVQEIVPAVLDHLNHHNKLIVEASTGAGKSTLLPLTLLNAPFLHGKKIIMLEPRRLAAKSIAYRMSEMLGEEIGETIGYRIKFENIVSKNTKIEVVTEGILTRMLQHDNGLEEVGMVIFDEFHERNIHADLALALSIEAQKILRPDLKLMIMSATLNLADLPKLINAPVVSASGKLFPVEIKYAGNVDEYLIAEETVHHVTKAFSEHEGDFLVFLPGQGEIKKAESLLKKLVPKAKIHPLYGLLTPNEQFRAIMPDRQGRRKIILATSIAETSLTIEGVSVVIDSGFTRTSKFDPKSGLSRLQTVRISKDSASQRAGRAGRLGPGTCIRLWNKATESLMNEYRTPEILEVDLANLMLDLSLWGIHEVSDLFWLNQPPAGMVSQALELLHQLEALEENKITAHGKKIHQFPTHPRIAHMLILANEMDKTSLACDIAALIEEKDPINDPLSVDLNVRIEELRRSRSEGLKIKKFEKIEKTAKNYRKFFSIEIDNDPIDPYETGLLLSQAYPERIAFARPGNNAQFQLANGKLAMMGHKADLSSESWLAISHIDARDGMGKIFLASPLNPRDLAPMVKEKENLYWDYKKEEFIAVKTLGIGSITLKSEPIVKINPIQWQEIVGKAISLDGLNLLTIDEEFVQLINRLESLRIWNAYIEWPTFKLEELIENNHWWLGPYLTNIRKKEDVKKLNLPEILFFALPVDIQQALSSLPTNIEVPSGSLIKINYSKDAEKPMIAVRLQEIFGWLETPKINHGKTPLLIHLLSPGFKPVQVTSDLHSFWSNTYFEVKKEMQRRYPKHSWPDDPLIAKAVKGVDRSRK